MELTDVLNAVKKWLDTTRTACGEKLGMEVLKDSDSCLRVIFQTEHNLCELIVEEPDFAPYRFVSFTVLRVQMDLRAEPIFCFYDDETCTLRDIIRELDKGIRCLQKTNISRTNEQEIATSGS